MNETLTNFRQAVADSTDLQEKVKAGEPCVAKRTALSSPKKSWKPAGRVTGIRRRPY